MAANTDDAYVHPTLISAWQLIGAVISIVAIIVFSLWTIVVNENSNNKAISDDVKANYTTKANHNDLVSRFVDFRVDTIRHIEEMHTRRDFEDWLRERNRLIEKMQSDINGTSTKVEQGLREAASKDALAGLQKQIDQLREQMQRISDREDRRHVNDAPPGK